MFDYLFYTSLIVFLLGLIYKISTWFTKKIGILGKDITTAQRLLSAARGIISVIFSSKILTLLKAAVLDVLFQRRILKRKRCPLVGAYVDILRIYVAAAHACPGIRGTRSVI